MISMPPVLPKAMNSYINTKKCCKEWGFWVYHEQVGLAIILGYHSKYANIWVTV